MQLKIGFGGNESSRREIPWKCNRTSFGLGLVRYLNQFVTLGYEAQVAASSANPPFIPIVLELGKKLLHGTIAAEPRSHPLKHLLVGSKIGIISKKYWESTW